MQLLKFFLLGLVYSIYASNALAENKIKKPKDIDKLLLNYWQEDGTTSLFKGSEGVISGSAILLTGLVGYYTTSNLPLKGAYSFLQTLGVLAIGFSVYQMNVPNMDQELNKNISKLVLDEKQGKLSLNHLQNLQLNYFDLIARQERGRRLVTAVSSSLLAGLYLVNTLTLGEINQLTYIYSFMTLINTIIAAGNWLIIDPIEKEWLNNQKLENALNDSKKFNWNLALGLGVLKFQAVF